MLCCWRANNNRSQKRLFCLKAWSSNKFDLHELWEITGSIRRLNLLENSLSGTGHATVGTYDEVKSATSCLQSGLQQLFDVCFLLETVRWYSKDPACLAPLIKTLFKKKSRPQALHGQTTDVVQLKQRTNNCVIKSRKALAGGKRCSMGWWKNVEELTRRRVEAVVSLDDKFLEQFSRFFGDLCKDERYIKPTLMEVPVMAPTPQLSTF